MNVILKGIGGFYYVSYGDDIIECKARGKFRLSIKPLVGDIVDIDIDNNNKGYIMNIHERNNQLLRPNVANINQILAIVSKAPPKTDLFLIDKLSAVAENKNIDFVICINKTDINNADEIYDIYTKIGYTVIRVSAINGDGILELREKLKNKITVFTGNSGVGKSTILNTISNDFIAPTGELSEKIGRGKHTTRHSELYKIEKNTFICDTPGFSTFETDKMDIIYKEKIADNFLEFKNFSCKYTDCSHTKEQACGIISAVLDGKIAKSRHESYIKMYNGVKDIKIWEKRQ